MNEIKINIYQDEDNVEHYQDYLNDYYLPIIKGRAILLYTLLKNSVNKKISEKNILNLLSFSKGEYVSSRKTLEALNLIETYKHIENDSSYIILVKPVLTPEKFFNKKHLRVLLLNAFNNDEEKFEDVINDYILNGFVILHNKRNQTIDQGGTYTEAYKQYSNKYDYIAFFDIDEFLHIDEPFNIKDILLELDSKGFNMIRVN